MAEIWWECERCRATRRGNQRLPLSSDGFAYCPECGYSEDKAASLLADDAEEDDDA